MKILSQSMHQQPISSAPGLIQRKYACSEKPSSLIGRCADCKKKKLPSAQTKLTVSASNDVYEQEADRVADHVMRMPAIERKNRLNRNLAGIYNGTLVQRESSNQHSDFSSAPSQIKDTISSGGKPLDKTKSVFMEDRFGCSFSQVNIHTRTAADRSAQSIDARTYMAGQNIVMADGQYQPNSHSGRRLLAHELAHVVQQTALTGETNLRTAPNSMVFRAPQELLCDAFFSDTAEGRIRTLVHEAAHLSGIGEANSESYCIDFDCETSCGGFDVTDSWSHLVHCLSGQTPDEPEVVEGGPQ